MQRKPIFDTIRQLLRRKFRSGEVAQIDRAIDCAEGDTAACIVSSKRQIGEDGVALIKLFEGCAKKRGDGMVQAYPDPGTGGDPWTIGWGATGKAIGRETVWSQTECDARLEADLERYSAEVAFAIGDAPTTPLQFDALVSFHYNTGAIGRATLTRKHVAGIMPPPRVNLIAGAMPGAA